MIECSICHVLNEDSARFCAECGQRLAVQGQDSAQDESLQPDPSALQGQPANPQDVQAPPPAAQVFDSTILSPPGLNSEPQDSSVAPQTGYQHPVENPINHASAAEFTPAHEVPPPAPVISTEMQAPKAAPPKLHSPLLQGDEIMEEDFGFTDYSSMRKDRTQFPHRSHPESTEPRAEAEAETLSTPKDTGKGSLHLRSPLLGSDEPDYPPPTASRPSRPGHLRSPLLGSDEPDYPPPQPKSSHPGHLRSPLLGGDFEDEDEYLPEDESTPSAPGALRSPLLQSKSPRSAGHTPKPGANEAQDFGGITPAISPDKARILQKLEKSKYGQLEEVTSAKPPQAPHVAPQPQETFSSPAPSADAAPASAGNAFPPSMMGLNPPTPTSEPSQPLTPPQASFEPPAPPPAQANNTAQPYLTQTPTSLPIQPPPQAPPQAEPPFPSAGWNLEPSRSAESSNKPAETTGPFGRVPDPRPEPPQETPRLRSKMLSGAEFMEPPVVEPASRRPGTSDIPRESENAGAVRFFVMLLYASVLMKLWLMFDYIKAGYATPSFIADQIGQLAVIFFLIFIGSIYSKPSS